MVSKDCEIFSRVYCEALSGGQLRVAVRESSVLLPLLKAEGLEMTPHQVASHTGLLIRSGLVPSIRRNVCEKLNALGLRTPGLGVPWCGDSLIKWASNFSIDLPLIEEDKIADAFQERLGRSGHKKPSGKKQLDSGEVRGIKSEDVWRMHFDEGKSIKDIAESYGVTEEAVRYHLKKSSRHSKGIKTEDVWRMWDSGQNTKDIARHYGVTVEAIDYHLRKLDTPSRLERKKADRKKKLVILGEGGMGEALDKDSIKRFHVFIQDLRRVGRLASGYGALQARLDETEKTLCQVKKSRDAYEEELEKGREFSKLSDEDRKLKTDRLDALQKEQALLEERLADSGRRYEELNRKYKSVMGKNTWFRTQAKLLKSPAVLSLTAEGFLDLILGRKVDFVAGEVSGLAQTVRLERVDNIA